MVAVNVDLGDNVRFEACAGCPRILNAQLKGKIHICQLAWAVPPLVHSCAGHCLLRANLSQFSQPARAVP